MTLPNSSEQTLALHLNSTLRSLPLAVDWLSACEVKTTGGIYNPADVCRCLVATIEELTFFRSVEFEKGYRPALQDLSVDFRCRIDNFSKSVNAEHEVNRAVCYAKLFADMEDGVDTAPLRATLMNARTVDGSSQETFLSRLFLALTCVTLILFEIMDAKVGMDWMDRIIF